MGNTIKEIQEEYAGSMIVTAINVTLMILGQFLILFVIMDKEPTPALWALSTVPALILVLIGNISKMRHDRTQDDEF